MLDRAFVMVGSVLAERLPPAVWIVPPGRTFALDRGGESGVHWDPENGLDGLDGVAPDESLSESDIVDYYRVVVLSKKVHNPE